MRTERDYIFIIFGFCDIQNNQGLGKGYQPQPSFSADNPYLDLDKIILDITKTSSNNCLLFCWQVVHFSFLPLVVSIIATSQANTGNCKGNSSIHV